MASIALRAVHKRYPNGQVAVRDVTLDIADGELLVLVGPSGSGKSTVLRLLAGLESPTAGRVYLDGVDVTAAPPQQRDLAMVFQTYALYPHKTVRDNLAFGLRVRGVDRREREERVQRTAAALSIETLLDRKPAQLSGGQRQRVALGRAIVREPRAFLLDEPLSNLDPLLRVATRAELALLHRRLGATMVYVTHDQEEAMTLGTRIAVMRDGQIEQVDPPLAVYHQPSNAFVARFVGAPTMNLWTCRCQDGGASIRLTSPAFTLDLDWARGAMPEAGMLVAGIRPHDVEVANVDASDARGRVAIVEPLGATTVLHVSVHGLPELVRLLVGSEGRIEVGAEVGIRLRRDRMHLFDEQTGRRIEAGV
ncbi:MAG TPA: ABC transporter ATP-binding protein [Vicinamibacterales bacterium]|nr:ABC transporter ATP-binding protein [Vicinamibacterales bacterium]